MRDIAAYYLRDLSCWDYLEILLVGTLLVTFLVEVGL
jgi:hypothetical protein